MWKNRDVQAEVLTAFDGEWMENTHIIIFPRSHH